jgi:hypothetical protein
MLNNVFTVGDRLRSQFQPAASTKQTAAAKVRGIKHRTCGLHVESVRQFFRRHACWMKSSQ